MTRILFGAASVFAVSFCLGMALAQPPYINPMIESHGKVIHLPDAAEQTRDASRICVDITADGPRDAINPGVEKLARFLNIYAGAGARPAAVQLTAVLLGKATTVALSDEAGRYLPPLANSELLLKRPVPDPMAATGSEEEIQAAFRVGRDRIRQIVQNLLDAHSA